jgi:dihydrofolate reductase
MLFGSANFAESLIAQGSVDEFRLMVSPQALGDGIPLFNAPIRLGLLEARPFQSGNVLLRYAPQR